MIKVKQPIILFFILLLISYTTLFTYCNQKEVAEISMLKDEKEQLLIAAIQYWLKSNNLHLIEKHKQIIYIPSEACSICIEGYLIRLGEPMLNRVLVLCETDELMNYIQNLNRIYNGEIKCKKVTPFFENSFFKLMKLDVNKYGVEEITIVK